jgi:ribonuclease D
MVLGYGDSIAYDQLVQRITGDSLDKSLRFTDWTRRPLSEAQIAYAISDVTHLRDVYVKLQADLDKRGRTEWMREEMRVLTSPDTYRMEPEHAWQRLQTRVRKPKELAVLIEVAAWRERGPRPATCRADACSGRRETATLRCRRQPPSSGSESALAAQGLRALEMGRGDHRGGQARARTRREDTAEDRASWSAQRPGDRRATKVLLRMTAERHGVAAKVIATMDDLDRIAADDDADVPALSGWRAELFGDKALAPSMAARARGRAQPCSCSGARVTS